MECHYHPDVKAVTTCKICGEPICNKCSIKMTGGDIWCYSCLKKSEENKLKWLKNFRIIAIIGVIFMDISFILKYQRTWNRRNYPRTYYRFFCSLSSNILFL